jgi:hypothetical protein
MSMYSTVILYIFSFPYFATNTQMIVQFVLK